MLIFMKNKMCLIKRKGVVLFLMGLWCFSVHSFAFSAEHRLPSAVIKLPDNENVILVEKETQTLLVYTSRADEVVFQFKVACSTGEAAGVKQKSGDKKTPEGVYFLKDEYEDKYLSPIYGLKAFPTDYPNFIDKRAGKNGSAIWIHGTNKTLKPYDSNGCVALENSNILKLSDYVTLDSTPVIMVEKIQTAEPASLARQEQDILSLLNLWQTALVNGSYHDYLAFYAPEYLPDILWWEPWLEIRKQSDKLDSRLKVEIDRVGIYHTNGLFVALFDWFLSTDKKRVWLGKRKLFINHKSNGYEIIGDIFQTRSKEFQTEKFQLISAAQKMVTPVVKIEPVIAFLQRWLAAWTAKDMDTYALSYAEDFYADGMNKKRWVKRKRMLAEKYEFIHVTGREFKIKHGEKMCEVSFFQEYESSGLTTHGTKKLKLVSKGGLWKIYRESWKEK